MSTIGWRGCVRVAPPSVVTEHHHRALVVRSGKDFRCLFTHPDDNDEVGQEHEGGGDAEEPEQPPLAHADLAIL